jgi:hypothetical protein
MKKYFSIALFLFVQYNSQAQRIFDLDSFRVAFFNAIDTAKGDLRKIDIGKVHYIGYFNSTYYTFTNDYKDDNNCLLSINLYKPEEIENLEPVFDEYARIHKLTKTVEIKKPTKEERKISNYKKETSTVYRDSLSKPIMEIYAWDHRPNDRYVIIRSYYKRESVASSSSINNNGFTTTNVNGITVATAKLERMDYKSGAIILYFGENRVVKNTSIYIVKFNKNNTNEENIANELRAGIAGVHPYMYFEFKEGYDCTSAQKYLRKNGIDPWSCLYITR